MINLEKFAGGALAEKVNMAYKEVLENIADVNTKAETKRKLVLELIFVPSEDREVTTVGIETKTKLAPTKAVATTILIDKDGRGGIVASEYNNQLKGQQFMQVDEETGEILSEEDLESAGIRIIK